MHGTLKVLLWAVAAVAAAPFIAFGAYDIFVFQPRMPEIRSLIANAAPEEQVPSQSVARVIHVAFSPHIGSHVARLLLAELKAVPANSGSFGQLVAGSAWSVLVSLHLSQPGQATLFLSLSPMGATGQGFAKASVAIVGTPLGSVSLAQAASLAVVAKAPALFLSEPERLANQSAILLRLAKNAL